MNYSKIKNMLDPFKKFREVKEQVYLDDERNYKVELLDFLGNILEKTLEDPAGGMEELLALLAGETAVKRYAGFLDNLLAYNGFAQRENFAVFLKNQGAGSTAALLSALFDESLSISLRFRDFRRRINQEYERLYRTAKFADNVKTRPHFTTGFTAILLMSHDHSRYTLYQPKNYEKLLRYLEIDIPGPVEEKYRIFVEACGDILAYARNSGYPLKDMVDVHNFIYMWNIPGYFKELSPASPDYLTVEKATGSGIYSYIRDSGFLFRKAVVTNYVLSLLTKPFVILTGISGTGKTKLALLLADYLIARQGGEGQKAFLSVRPDWTDSTYLLGYYNTITEKYEATPLLKLLLRAGQEPEKPFFVILDEMNIAKVEHYFSDFLSCLESRRPAGGNRFIQEPIILHHEPGEIAFMDEEGREWLIPPRLEIPFNIFFTGTVNIDETTYMFSPKVLDRANTLELNEVYLDQYKEMKDDFTLVAGIDLEKLFSRPTLPPQHADFLSFAERHGDYHALLVQINELLSRYNMHFGYRVANEIAAYMNNVNSYSSDSTEVLGIAFDLQIKQKILPKFSGSAAKLEEPLRALQKLLGDHFVQSRAKIEGMLKQLELTGFASFIE